MNMIKAQIDEMYEYLEMPSLKRCFGNMRRNTA